MMRLLRVELQRLAARRLVRLLLLLLLVALVATAVLSAVNSNRDVAGARAKAERQAADIQIPPEELEACEREKASPGVPENFQCRPIAADFYSDPRLKYADSAHHFANGGVGLGLAFAGIVAIGVIGAEWAAGTFAALLLWEPRRRRVLAAKLAAVSVTGAVVTAVLGAVFTGVAWLVASTRGSIEGGVGAATNHALLNAGRGTLAAVLLALILGSLAVLVRSTAGALGIVAVYVIVVENVVRVWRPHWTRWQLGPNLIALIAGRLDLEPIGDTGGPTASIDGTFSEQLFRLSAGRATIYLLVLAAVAVAGATVFFQRRDVT